MPKAANSTESKTGISVQDEPSNSEAVKAGLSFGTRGARNTLSALHLHPFRIGLFGGLGVLLAITLGSVVSQLSTLIVYVGLAMFLALGLDPVVRWLQRRGLKRAIAILIVVAGVLAIVGGLIATVVPIAIAQISNLVQNWAEIVKSIVASDFVKWLNALTPSGKAIDEVLKAVTDWLTNPSNISALGGGLLNVGLTVGNVITGTVIVIILMLYFIASIASMKRYATRFVPAESRSRFNDVTAEITGAVGRYVMGQTGLGAINGVLSLIFLSIIGAPFPALLAFVAFLFSLVPLVGTLSGAVIISLVCLTASPLTALVAVIYYLIYMQVEAYVLSPRIMARAVAVPGALAVIAAVAGGTLGGVAGALVAIPVAASIIIILERVVLRLPSRLQTGSNQTIAPKSKFRKY